MAYFAKYRNAKGYTQAFVAQELGITRQAYNNYELGKRQADYETLLKLSELLEVSVEALLTGRVAESPIESYKMPDNKEAAILKGSRRDFFDILNGLSETELTELENYVRFLLWKHTHSDL